MDLLTKARHKQREILEKRYQLFSGRVGLINKIGPKAALVHLAKYVAQAQTGQVIELTSHRKIVARIVGVPQHGSAGLDRLVATGAASWSGGKPKGAAIKLSEGGKSLSDIVTADRG
jgi:antitoxin (DNA-binding transcriptional repressor) of toxin-antitoxin stability system